MKAMNGLSVHINTTFFLSFFNSTFVDSADLSIRQLNSSCWIRISKISPAPSKILPAPSKILPALNSWCWIWISKILPAPILSWGFYFHSNLPVFCPFSCATSKVTDASSTWLSLQRSVIHRNMSLFHSFLHSFFYGILFCGSSF